jgi:Uma2 family endonuclease
MSVTAIPHQATPVRGGLTVDDLEGMPDDGRRHELVDGVLLVTPAPRWEHQRAEVRLAVALGTVCPGEFDVLTPIDVRGGSRTSVQPDLSVVRSADLLPGRPFQSVPVLAVEILSPGTAETDRVLKRRVYAELGVASYWIVDVDAPSVTVLALDGDRYAEQAVVRGDEPLAVTEPFPVVLRPSQLVRTGARRAG